MVGKTHDSFVCNKPHSCHNMDECLIALTINISIQRTAQVADLRMSQISQMFYCHFNTFYVIYANGSDIGITVYMVIIEKVQW